ncbi:MAG: hypothetical protein PHS94_09845 [Erysipelotrichaceae bacterium]|nr:hypothetical protein [Erysipelotrichaceae bacterium]
MPIELVTTAGFVTRGTLDLFLEKLAQKNIHVSVFAKFNPDSTISVAQEAVRLYVNSRGG